MKWKPRPRMIAPKTHNSGALPDDAQAREQLKVEEGRAFKTYRAREAAARRLAQRARAWNSALVAFSTATTIAAIGLLTDHGIYGAHGDTLLVCLAILALVASLITANLDYSGRSRDMFINYRKLQRIAVEMEELHRQCSQPINLQVVKELSGRYQAILDEAENHTQGDHLRHFSRTLPLENPHHCEDSRVYNLRRREMSRDWLITALPYSTLVVPVALLVRLAVRVFE